MTPSHSPALGAPTANGSRSPAAAPPSPSAAETGGLPPALAGPPGLETLLNVLRRYGLTIVVVGLGFGLLAAFAAFAFVPGRYGSQTKVQVAARMRNGEEVDTTANQKAQMAVLKSDKVLRNAVRSPRVVGLATGQSEEELVAWLQKDITAEFPYGPEVIVVTLAGERSDIMAPLLDEVVAAYRDEVTGRDRARIEEHLKALREKYAKVSTDLRDKRLALAFRETQLGIKDPVLIQSEMAAVQGRLNNLNSKRLEVQLRRGQMQHEIDSNRVYLESRWFRPTALLPVSPLEVELQVANDLRMRALATQELEIQNRMDVFRRQAGPNPNKAALEKNLAPLEAEVNIVRASMRTTRENQIPGIEAHLRANGLLELSRKTAALERQVRDADNEDSRLAEEEARETLQLNALRAGGARPMDKAASDLNGLRDAVTQTERVHTVVGNEIGQLEAETVTTNRVTVLETAGTAATLKGDRRYKTAGAAFLSAFALVFLAFAVVEFVRKPLRRPEEVSRGLILPVLGTLPRVTAKSERPLAPSGAAEPSPEQAAVLEAIDAVRASVLYAARTEPLHVLMVSSPKSGEGKTAVAAHLAASLARSWRNVLLVDGDLRQPTLHSLFDLPQGPGFAEVLREEIDIDEVVQPTSLARLAVLPAGRGDRAAIEALSQGGLAQQMARMKENFDFIVIDVSPVLETADALQLGQHADAVILSVRQSVSRLQEVHGARERLESLGIRVLGAVVGA